MKLLSTLILLLCLTGCATISEDSKPSVVVQHQVEVLTLPDGVLVIPAPVERIDLKTSSQKTVSDWLARSEKRTETLENQLIEIKKIQDEQVQKAKEKSK